MTEPAASSSGFVGRTWRRMKQAFSGTTPQDVDYETIRQRTSTPVLWLYGKTQSGKSSVVRFLTGATDAEIGSGFRPCTLHSRSFPFPNDEAPVVTFLDTRGIEDPAYDPQADLQAFAQLAHLQLVTCRLTDFAHGKLRESLQSFRTASPQRPILLVLTCLHEAYPQRQHPDVALTPEAALPPEYLDAVRLIEEQRRAFAGLVDRVVAVDLTQAEEGFDDRTFGGNDLKQDILEMLPLAYRQTLLHLDATTGELRDLHLERAAPTLTGYAGLAAAAGAFPIPFVDLLMLPGIQSRMIHALARLSGKPDEATKFLALSTSLGLGLLVRQATRQVAKFIPYVGSAVGAAMAYGSTYALGRAFLTYLQQVHAGQAPDLERVKSLYHEQLNAAAARWKQEAE